MSKLKLSVVTTLYKSRAHIQEFNSRILSEAKKLVGDSFEIIFVDDGSPDDSSTIVTELAKVNHKIKLMQLSRNFGHHKALRAGLDMAVGDLIYVLDVDLEDQPEWLSLFHQQMLKVNADVIIGKQRSRKGNILEKTFGSIWYKILNFWVPVGHESNTTTARLMTREYLDSFKKFTERDTIISGIHLLTGFNQVTTLVTKKSVSPTTYTLSKKISLVINTLISLSNKPLFFVLGLNFFFSITALIFGSYVFIHSLWVSSKIEGWASLALLVTASYFLLSLCITVIGLYVAQINLEVKNRPIYLSRENK